MIVNSINDIISECESCMNFLDDLAFSEMDMGSRNVLLNHALSIRLLIYSFKELQIQYKKVQDDLDRCAKELRLVKQKEIDPILSKRFEELKDSLISYIEEF